MARDREEIGVDATLMCRALARDNNTSSRHDSTRTAHGTVVRVLVQVGELHYFKSDPKLGDLYRKSKKSYDEAIDSQ